MKKTVTITLDTNKISNLVAYIVDNFPTTDIDVKITQSEESNSIFAPFVNIAKAKGEFFCDMEVQTKGTRCELGQCQLCAAQEGAAVDTTDKKEQSFDCDFTKKTGEVKCDNQCGICKSNNTNSVPKEAQNTLEKRL